MVLTGGTACLEGLPELVEQIFNLPVRRGYPAGIGGLLDVVNNPMYATGVGLVLYGRRHRSEGRFKSSDRNLFGRVALRMKRWFSEFFKKSLSSLFYTFSAVSADSAVNVFKKFKEVGGCLN